MFNITPLNVTFWQDKLAEALRQIVALRRVAGAPPVAVIDTKGPEAEAKEIHEKIDIHAIDSSFSNVGIFGYVHRFGHLTAKQLTTT